MLRDMYHEAIPRIQAAEKLDLSQVLSVNSGHMKRGQANSLIRSWKRAANRGRRPLRRPTLQQRLTAAAAMGITVREA